LRIGHEGSGGSSIGKAGPMIAPFGAPLKHTKA
jgi:hypothetical protein